jgi:hypothetical protein
MLLRNLFEDMGPVADAAFAFGRFNPAHQGHIEVYKTVQNAGRKWYIGTNPSTQGPNDPLSFEQKSAWMQAIYPAIQGHLLPQQSVVTLASKLYELLPEGSTIAYVTDIKDWEWAGKLLNDYNGKEGPHGYYKFRAIKHVESPRVSSATALRTAARANDEAAFYAASGTDPELTVGGKTYFETVVDAVGAHPEKVKKVAKKKEQGVTESLGTMPTTEYVKGIYAAAAENGMGAPDVEAVRKQMVLAANGEVDIMATMQKALRVFQDPKFKQMLADLDALIKKAESGQGVSEGEKQSKSKEMDLDWHYKNIINTKGLSDKAKKDTTDIYNKLKKKKEQGVAEGYKEERLKGCKCQHRQGDNKKCPIHGVQEGVAEGERMKTASGMYRDQHTGVAYRGKTGQDGNDSYMTPDYLIQKYQERLAQIASGPYKRPKEVAQLKSRIAKLQGQQGVAEAGSNAMADTAKRLANKDDGKVAKLRAAGDKRREAELKGRNIAKRNESVDLKTSLQELSNDMLGKYKKAASADASKADKEGNVKRGDKRFSGIVKATNKQFANDAKKTK